MDNLCETVEEAEQNNMYNSKYKLLSSRFKHMIMINQRLRSRICHIKNEILGLRRLKRHLFKRLLRYGDRFMESCLEIPDTDPVHNALEDGIFASVCQRADHSLTAPGPSLSHHSPVGAVGVECLAAVPKPLLYPRAFAAVQEPRAVRLPMHPKTGVRLDQRSAVNAKRRQRALLRRSNQTTQIADMRPSPQLADEVELGSCAERTCPAPVATIEASWSVPVTDEVSSLNRPTAEAPALLCTYTGD